MKTFQFQIQIDAEDIDSAVVELAFQFVASPAGRAHAEDVMDADKIWRFVKERVNHMEVLDVTGFTESEDGEYPTEIGDVESLEERS